MYFLYECDFNELKERLSDDIDSDTSSLYSPLGEYICKLLSIDFEKVSESISSFLVDCKNSRTEFPTNQLQAIMNEMCGVTDYDEMRDMAAELKYFYTTETQEVFDAYGSLKDAFMTVIFDFFKVGAIIQAYLEESESAPEMTSSINFERFVNGFLEMNIRRNSQAESLSEYDSSLDIFPGCNIKKIVKDAFSHLIPLDDSFSIFATDSFDRLLVNSVYYFFLHGFIFKRCKNCGKFFVPLSRSDEIYCNNISPQDNERTCKEYGSRKLWYDRLKNDEAARLARNIYSAKQMLVRRNPDIPEYKEMFELFKTEKKKWEEMVKTGEKTREDYIVWLNKMKAQKTLK